MKDLNDFSILAICFKRLRLWLVILLLCTILGCILGYQEVEVYLRVTHPSNYLPVFEVSEDEQFENPATIRGLRVYSLGDTGDRTIPEEIYWRFYIPYKGSPGNPLNSHITPVTVSRITYGIVPEGVEECDVQTAARPLEPGVKYCVTVNGFRAAENPVECFIYRP